MRDALYRQTQARHYASVQRDAREIIARAVAMADGGPVAVGVSGGKDSVAMAHLVAQQCRPAIIYNDSGLETPESIDVVRALCDRLDAPLHIAKGDAMAVKMAGLVGAAVDEATIVRPVRAKLAELGIALEFVGLRSCESKRRRFVLRKHGPIYASKRWGCLIAWPMRAWTGADVFAYLDEHGLPMHPAYARVSHEDRDMMRVSWAYDSTRERLGEVEMVRRHYPALFRMLRERGIIR